MRSCHAASAWPGWSRARTRSRNTDRLRHAGNTAVFDQVRALSTSGTFLRGFTHGRVHQLNAVLRRVPIAPAERTPLVPGAEEVAWTHASAMLISRIRRSDAGFRVQAVRLPRNRDG